MLISFTQLIARKPEPEDEEEPDEAIDDETDKKSVCQRFNAYLSKQTISPESRYKVLWDMFANTCYLIGFFEISYNIAFDLETLPQLWLIDSVLDYVNLLDIIACSFTRFQHEESVVTIKATMNKQTTASNLKSALDVLWDKHL